MRDLRIFAVVSMIFGFWSVTASAAQIARCVTKTCAADDANCIELNITLHAFDDPSQNSVQVTRKFGERTDTYYNGGVMLNLDRCNLSAVEAQHTPKELSLSIDVPKGQAQLNMLVHGEPLPDKLSELECTFTPDRKELSDCVRRKP